MKDQAILETGRLILRPFELSDAKRVQELAGEKKIAEYTLNIPHPYEDGMAEAWISSHRDSFKKGENISYAIIKKETNELMGAINLAFEQGKKQGQIGYWMGLPYWKQGYCTEACKKLIDLGFEEYKINRIYARAMVANTASWRVMEKAGMRYEGNLSLVAAKDGQTREIKEYAIHREQEGGI